MTDLFQGFVLRAPRVAPANAATTAPATNGVIRDSKPLSASYGFTGPDLVEADFQQYKAAILDREEITTEYLIWAANTGNISTTDDSVFEEAQGSIPRGTSDVYEIVDVTTTQIRRDGTDRVVVTDIDQRSIHRLIRFTIVRGDTGAERTLQFALNEFAFDAVSGIAVVDSSFIGTADPPTGFLEGGLSRSRGDRIVSIQYNLQGSRFWWTRNDSLETRFAYDAGVNRWKPLNGSSPRNLGQLSDESITLSPSHGVAVGQYLPGDSATADAYSMVRLGAVPDAGSIPVAEPAPTGGFGGILVVSDDAAAGDHDFATTPAAAGVVGETSGTVMWNPAFVETYAGLTIWYSYRGFQEGETGNLGRLIDAEETPLFISPIPAPTDYPFIRLGSRNPLQPQLFESDAGLATALIGQGEVGVSLTTGKLKFGTLDLDAANPESANFDVRFLGAEVFYTGVSLTQEPLRSRDPVQLVDESGSEATLSSGIELYLPDAEPLPGPGKSGVIFGLDSTGTPPNTTTAPTIRPNDSGLVREIEGVGDLIVFTESGVLDQVDVVDTDDDLPSFSFKIRFGRAVISREEGAQGSRVAIGSKTISEFSGEKIFFMQAGVMPAFHYREARIYARGRDTITLEGTEILRFAIDGNDYTWDASTNPGAVGVNQPGTFTVDQIAESLNATIQAGAAIGEAVTFQNRLALQTTNFIDGVRVGRIEIGFGPGTTLDISGASALGFLPGWKIQISQPAADDDVNFVPDSGVTVGVYRSPLNLDRTKPIADFKHRARIEDVVLSESVIASPVVLLNQNPLEDEAGYDDHQFFRLVDGLSIRYLSNFDQVFYEFGEGRFSWADQYSTSGRVQVPTVSINLTRTNILEDSFISQLGGQFSISEAGGPFVPQTEGEDFILDGDGVTGEAILVEKTGDFVASGSLGSVTQGSTTFVDNTPGTDFVADGVKKGYRLKLTGTDAEGSYIVTTDAAIANELEVTPTFPATAEPVGWEIYEGKTVDEIDEQIIADKIYKVFNHLPDEPFQIRLLDGLGTVPNDATELQANRPEAVVRDALDSGRPIELRFGLPNASPTASLILLQTSDLGIMANNFLFVPYSNERFANDDWSLLVGSTSYTFGVNLTKVATFTYPLPGDEIEVLDSTGELRFGDETLDLLAGSNVTYVEEFLTPAWLNAGEAELRASDGAINLSADDMAAYGGEDLYFVEQLITVDQQDVSINPMGGAFALNKPVREGQIVEAKYFLADASGDLLLDDDGNPTLVIEFLPLFVRAARQGELETMEPVPGPGASDVYSFNPTGRTVQQDIEPQVFIGGNLVGFAGNGRALFNYLQDEVRFDREVDPSEEVRINYAVLEAFGGEQAYSTSQSPIYRPPFYLAKNSNTFELDTDRTSDMIPGTLFRPAESVFYVTQSSYDSFTDKTTVTVFPTPTTEAGSRSPGHDTQTLLSTTPVSLDYGADQGFWRDITATFETVAKGALGIIFNGNLSEIIDVEHVLEIGGYPFIVKGVSVSDDGLSTTIDLTSPIPINIDTAASVRFSVRPVFGPDPTTFGGIGPIVDSEPVELVIFGETNPDGSEKPGRTLTRFVDYDIDFDAGVVQFLGQPALSGSQWLLFRHTERRVLAPLRGQDIIIYPRFRASFTHVTTPDETNGYLDKILQATYNFESPDSFYFRTVPVLEYAAEVAEAIAQDVASVQPSSGPVVAVAADQENYEAGSLSLAAQLSDLEDQDRIGRVFVDF